MLLCFCQFSTEECNLPITLSYNCTKLFRQDISVHLTFLQIIWVSQSYIFCNCSLHIVKSCLMYLIPVPSMLLGLIGSGDFGMATLSYPRGEWGKHFTTSCPKISIVLDHAQEPMEVFDLFWWCYCGDCLHFVWLWLYCSPCEDIP